MSWSRWARRPVILVAVLGAFVMAPSAGASHSWNGYHWARTANPFTLRLGDNVSSTWDPHLATTSSDWSASSVLDTTIAPGATRPKVCKGTSGQVQVCSDRYGSNGWLGVAQIYVNATHITQATVKVNDTYFATSTYNTPAWRNLVMCQEVGHALGLDHQDENFSNAPLGTCMDYTSDPTPNQHPNQHDYDQLASIYAHTDSTTTVGAGSLSARQRADTPPEWGRLVRGSANRGAVAVYERDLGAGQKIFTFVIWAA